MRKLHGREVLPYQSFLRQCSEQWQLITLNGIHMHRAAQLLALPAAQRAQQRITREAHGSVADPSIPDPVDKVGLSDPNLRGIRQPLGDVCPQHPVQHDQVPQDGLQMAAHQQDADLRQMRDCVVDLLRRGYAEVQLVHVRDARPDERVLHGFPRLRLARNDQFPAAKVLALHGRNQFQGTFARITFQFFKAIDDQHAAAQA